MISGVKANLCFIFVCCFGAMLLPACSSVKHDPQEYHRAGQPLPITVTLDRKEGEAAKGAVHWRITGQNDYRALDLRQRGDELWAQLPVEQAPIGASVEYFIDVDKGGRFVPLGSVGDPYTTRIVDPVHFSILKMSHRVDYGDSHQPIRFHLYTGGARIDHAEVVYNAPDLPGEARAPMLGPGGHWFLEISDRGVRSGAWYYHINIHLNGKVYRLPEGRDAGFIVSSQTPPNLMLDRERDRNRIKP